MKLFRNKHYEFKLEICKKVSQKGPSAKTLDSDRNLNFIITRCSYLAEMKLQYAKNTFHVVDFDITIGL